MSISKPLAFEPLGHRTFLLLLVCHVLRYTLWFRLVFKLSTMAPLIMARRSRQHPPLPSRKRTLVHKAIYLVAMSRSTFIRRRQTSTFGILCVLLFFVHVSQATSTLFGRHLFTKAFYSPLDIGRRLRGHLCSRPHSFLSSDQLFLSLTL